RRPAWEPGKGETRRLRCIRVNFAKSVARRGFGFTELHRLSPRFAARPAPGPALKPTGLRSPSRPDSVSNQAYRFHVRPAPTRDPPVASLILLFPPSPVAGVPHLGVEHISESNVLVVPDEPVQRG